jgi:hypothetical protein
MKYQLSNCPDTTPDFRRKDLTPFSAVRLLRVSGLPCFLLHN